MERESQRECEKESDSGRGREKEKGIFFEQTDNVISNSNNKSSHTKLKAKLELS